MRRDNPPRFDVEHAVAHCAWLARYQSPGFFFLRMFAQNGDEVELRRSAAIRNIDPDFQEQVRAFVKNACEKRLGILYSVNSFRAKRATHDNALPTQILHVDADRISIPPPGPEPSRIVASSPGNHHFFYVLDETVDPVEAAALNKALTYKMKGDKGGHSAAKLFRLPGTINQKPQYGVGHPIRVVARSKRLHAVKDIRNYAQPVDARDRKARSTGSVVVLEPASESASEVVKKFKSRMPFPLDQSIMQNWFSPTSFRINIRTRTGIIKIEYKRDDRSRICFQIMNGLLDLGATTDQALAVTMASPAWRSRGGEDPDRFLTNVLDHRNSDQNPDQNPDPFEGEAAFIDPAEWSGLPVPEQPWLLRNWIPREVPTGIYGDGGTGKTTLMLQLAVATALDAPFLGMPIESPGRVLAFLAENNLNETWRSIDCVVRGVGHSLADLSGRFLVSSFGGLDASFVKTGPSDIEQLSLFKAFKDRVKKFRPTLIIIDNVADVFAGNENDRTLVRKFIQQCGTALARETGGAVVFCAHPSREGLRSDGSSGSTGWNNSLRSRMNLLFHKDHVDQRVLSLEKSNKSARGEKLTLVWKDGIFEHLSDHAQNADDRTHDQWFVREVEKAFESGTPFSGNHQGGHRYIVPYAVQQRNISAGKARKTLSRLMRDGAIREAVRDRSRHLNGLCTPEQAERYSANETAAKLRSASK